MTKKTPLYQAHVDAGAKIVNFHGWMMPIHYGSQVEEHHAVRNNAGVFDVSHMTVVDVLGPGARDYLRYLLCNDVDKLKSRGKALYTCMLNYDGGIIDDLIVYFIDVQHYRVVLNAATRDKDLARINQTANDFSVGLHEREDLGIIAVQGPRAREKTNAILTPEQADLVSTLTPFEFIYQDDFMIARTGYTGEDGYEIILPNDQLDTYWQKLLSQDIRPCGLGARDTLRLEAGLNLYGQDMDENQTPLDSGLSWTVTWEPQERLFIGRAALELMKSKGVKQKFVGIVLEGKGVLRCGQKLTAEDGQEGIITSGTFSPTLGVGIAMAKVPKAMGDSCLVDIRGKAHAAKVIKLPFVRHGKKMFD